MISAITSWCCRHPLVLIFLGALGLRLGNLCVQVVAMGTTGVLSEDSFMYLERSALLLAHGEMVREDAVGNILPATDMMPLYLWFLVIHHVLFADPAFSAAITQCLIDAGTCVLIARIGRAFSPGAGVWSGVIAAANPTMIVLSGLVLMETVFLHFCVLGILVGFLWLNHPTWRLALILGVALALGIQTRTMLLPWTVALPVLMLIGQAFLHRLRLIHFAQMIVVILIALVVQAPIAARNYTFFDHFSLSSQGGAYLGLWLAPLVREAADGTSHAAGAAEVNREFATRDIDHSNPFERSEALVEIGLATIKDAGPVAVVKAFGMGAAVNLMSPAGTVSPWVRALPRTGFYDTPGDTKWQKISTFLFHNENSTYGWILLLGIVGVLGTRLAQLVGLIRGVRSHRANQIRIGILVSWVAFIILINGPIASPKYRQPAEAALCVMLALAVRPPRLAAAQNGPGA